ncbi:hypothetical protein [Actinocrinis sp.]|uniref:hypothetical protein n=1 Tax=Actinocrinis sp. TaxID=1920516 RepID=UPI002DDD7C82|nr:hypothetical protein [Actinocrinis sp.]
MIKLPFSHAKKYIPSRRSMAGAGAAVAMLAGPLSLVTAGAVSSTAAASATSANAAYAESAPDALVAKFVAARSATPAKRPAAPASLAAKPPMSKPPVPKPAAPKALASAPAAARAAASAPKPAVRAAVAKPADPYAGVTAAQLEPAGLYGYQEYFVASPEQWQNAKTIVRVAQRRGMFPYAAVIAIATALQESTLRNLTVAVDADSLGLFQQRPSMGWGSASQLTDPAYATGAFLSALTQYAPAYGSMPLWQAAQATQRSGYPTAYARWEDQAARMVAQIAAGG